MAAGAWTFTNGGRTSLIDGTFDINSDTWKMALFLSTSDIGAASTTFARWIFPLTQYGLPLGVLLSLDSL